MSVLDGLVVAVIAGEPLSLGAVLRRARRTGQLDLLESAIMDRLITRAIEERGIVALPIEVERARALFRADHHLDDDGRFVEWLAARGRSEEELDRELASIITFGKLKEGIASAAVEPYFERHREALEVVYVSSLSRPEAPPVRLRRSELPRQLEAAPEGTVAGDQRIERRVPAVLDHETRRELHARIFAGWLEGERARVGVTVLLDELLGSP